MIELPFSESCERNKKPILGALEKVLPEKGLVLEIGSCTGQHIVYFARVLPHLTWQPSDQKTYLAGLTNRIGQEGSQNILYAIELDVTTTWPDCRFDAVYSANTAHIMSWSTVRCMFAGVGEILRHGGVFCLYGPFNEEGRFTSRSNEDFDRSLRARDPAMGIRDIEAIETLADGHQLVLVEQVRLPANNSLLVFRKIQGLADD